MSTLTPFAPAPSPPSPPAPVDGQPLRERPKSFFTGRFGLIFGLVASVVSVLAVVLASSGPLMVNHASVPSGMTKVYDGTPNDSTTWSSIEGCSQAQNGLDVTSSNQHGCQFLPSGNADLLSQGFYLSLTLAPDASVTDAQVPLVALGNNIFVAFDQAGTYLICTGTCDTFSGDTRVSGSASAWHTDGYTPNTFTLIYQPGADNGRDALVLFVNGQQAHMVDLSVASGADLVLAATEPAQGEPGEAIYTHVTLYSSSPQSPQS